jgi:F-type H+-transporting ATPase subunit delta
MPEDMTTVARPYAQAAFDRAVETEQLDAWSQGLALVAEISDNPEMARQIANPNVPRDRLSRIILEIAGDGLSTEMKNLVRLLAANNRLAAMSEIARLFDALRIERQRVRQVHVRSAYAVNAAQQKVLAEALKRRFGGAVELTVEKDPSLLGGVEIRAGDLVIDGSIRGKLQRLANELQI